jgi:2-polyprenyl-6-methoxyphenol hydroxylase-like FAD-dependent oxidoreductase
VVGADGLHSNVRNLVFGDKSQIEKFYMENKALPQTQKITPTSARYFIANFIAVCKKQKICK